MCYAEDADTQFYVVCRNLVYTQPKGARLMSPNVTSASYDMTFDLLIPEVDRSICL